MLKPQKKISRKEIKEDKLVSSYFNMRRWIEENQRLVWYIVLAPVAIAAIWFWWNSKTTEWNEKATAMVAKVTPYYDQGRYDMAINGVPQEGVQGLQAVVDEHGSTQSGQIAKLYLANSYYAIKNYDKALEYYKDISVSDKLISAAALAGAAACYEAKNDYASAASYFEKAASKNMTLMQAPENLQRSAVNYAAAGKKEKAIELLQTLKKEFPASSTAREVDRFIAEYSL
jgi:tetratricopeptide (TPR) repeat protein